MSDIVAPNPVFADPVTFEVYRSQLVGLADEMGLIILRTSHSPILNHALDFSTAVCDASGRVLAQGNSMMVHIGTFPDAMSMIVDRWRDDLAPGDVFIFNDEDRVSQHLPDMYVAQPYFVGRELVGFGICCAHHVDIGGHTAGGMDVLAQSIFAEGIRIPLVKLYRAGKADEAVLAILKRNVRLPELLMGDLSGQLAALHAGEGGIAKLVERYGSDHFARLAEELLDYTERMVRREIAAIPDGRYEFADQLDDDGVGGGPVPLRVAITVRGDAIEVDWTGSGPQAASAINCHIANTRSISYGALQATFREQVAGNDGFRRAVDVVAPPNTIVNAGRTAARGARGLTIYRMVDTMLGALAQAMPERVPAAADGGPALVRFFGVDREGEAFVLPVGPWISGWGARMGSDGLDHASPLGANFANIPVEEVERSRRVRFEHRGFVPDTEGVGCWRGCYSVRFDIRFLSEGTLQLLTQRRVVRPYGLAGGHPGSASSNTIDRGSGPEQLPISAAISVSVGDLVSHVHSSGGGWGNPLEREPEAVLQEVLDEKMSRTRACEQYGVVLDDGLDGHLAVDRIGTLERRSDLGAASVCQTP
jgi:N-methylhydantoinase B